MEKGKWRGCQDTGMDRMTRDQLFEEALENIIKNHNQIIDDWCKAYLAELYQKGMDIKPGCFTLVEQEGLTLQNGKLGKHYWFEPKDEKETSNERLVKILMKELNKIKDYIEDQINFLAEERYVDQFQAKLILNQLKKMVEFLE